MKESIQTVGYASWADPQKWMESMKGTKWRRLIQEYTKEYEAAVLKEGDLPSQIEKEFEERESSIPPTKLYEYSYQQVGRQTFLWWFTKGKKTACTDLDIGDDGWIWYVTDTDSGDESFSLHGAYKGDHTWTSNKKPFGPFVACVKNRVYSIESENHLWFCRLVSFDAKTGKDRRLEYEETNPEWNLTLIKGENHCLFLVANNAGKQRLWFLNDSGAMEEIQGYESFVPVGFASKTPVYFGRKAGSDRYEFSQGDLSFLRSSTPEFACLGEGLVVTRRFGKRTLWNLKTGKKVETLVGHFQADLLMPWAKGVARFSLSRPGYAMSLYEPNVDCLCGYARSSYAMAKSNDGTLVPYVIVTPRNVRCHALIVVGYGAYGIPTHLNTDRWKPLLRRGWGVCLAMIRGGGDHTDSWAEQARTLHKEKSMEDFEACIRASQRTLHISASHTAIYGRSAGGYLVGSTVNRNPNGQLFGFAYLEVPYLDVLATTSNPDLPLTQLEYNEFGDPLHKPQNFRALLNVSPVDTIPTNGVPGIFILCRTGLNDKEVFPYESVKWITRLKETNGQPKLLAVEAHQGHFSGRTSAGKLRAKDLSLLLGWASRISTSRKTKKKYHVGIYKMANTRRNRKNNASRKNRKNRKNNVTARKNRKNNNAMMGGKRRNRKNNTTMRRRR